MSKSIALINREIEQLLEDRKKSACRGCDDVINAKLRRARSALRRAKGDA